MRIQHPFSPLDYCPRCGHTPWPVHDFKSRRCPECGFHLYANSAAAVAALLVDDEGRLLTITRRYDPARGLTDLPGGFVDPGESLEQALEREMREETGLSVVVERYLLSCPNTYAYGGLLVPTLDTFFLCRPAAAEAPLSASPISIVPSCPAASPDTEPPVACRPGDDAASLRWVPLHQVRPDDFAFPSTRQALRHLLPQLIDIKCIP